MPSRKRFCLPKSCNEQSRPGPKGAAMGEAGSSEQSTAKKDSRGWEEQEKALVKK